MARSPMDAASASQGAFKIFGVALVGVSAETGRKLVLTLGFVLGVMLLGKVLRWVTSRAVRDHKSVRAVFWTRQGIALVTFIILALGLLSIWFNDPSRLASVVGLITAGIAVALQRVITAVAGYFVILRGRTFTIGDRITMGGVRGDVIALGFIQTTIMEMGQPPGEQSDAPAMWVHGRQYTGRVVTITNEKIFDTPVYNYTREFPYIWDEMKIRFRTRPTTSRLKRSFCKSPNGTRSTSRSSAPRS